MCISNPQNHWLTPIQLQNQTAGIDLILTWAGWEPYLNRAPLSCFLRLPDPPDSESDETMLPDATVGGADMDFDERPRTMPLNQEEVVVEPVGEEVAAVAANAVSIASECDRNQSYSLD